MTILRKPPGIVLASLFCGLLGLLLLPVGYITALASGVRGAPHYASAYGLLCMALGAVTLAGAYGLWRMRAWGRALAIQIVLATLPISALGHFGMSSGGKMSATGILSSIIGLALAFAILRYLRRGDIRQMYERPSVLLEDRLVALS